jgi:hypothetical protein
VFKNKNSEALLITKLIERRYDKKHKYNETVIVSSFIYNKIIAQKRVM